MKSPEGREWRRSGVFIVNFEHMSHICSSVSSVNFEQVNADQVESLKQKKQPVLDVFQNRCSEKIRNILR